MESSACLTGEYGFSVIFSWFRSSTSAGKMILAPVTEKEKFRQLKSRQDAATATPPGIPLVGVVF